MRQAAPIAYETDPDPADLQLRPITRQRHIYYRDDLSAALPLGQFESLALPHTTYTLALTPGLVTLAYGTRVDDATLTDEGRYLSQDGLWWAPSGRAVFDPARFYLATAAIDPFGQRHVATYDDHALLATGLTDPLGNQVTAAPDYRVLQPALVTDPNGNQSAVAFDALGMPVATAVMGKPGAGEGDTLADPTTRLEYDLHRWQTAGTPPFVHTLAREQHGAADTRWLERYAYWDGSGRVAMTKVMAEPGPDGAPRWVGTGRTVFDNKGHPIKQYEPFFSATPDYEDEASIVEWGVTPIFHYDPVGRLVRTDLPDGTYTKVVFDAWRQEAWDASDTVADAPWLARMQAGTPAEQRAAAASLAHAGTPSAAHADALGRTFLAVADNGPAGLLPIRSVLDASGHVRSLTDARGVVAATARSGPLGHALVAATADAGQVVTLFDVAGKPLRAWNARGIAHRTVYDALQRPTHLYAQDQPADGGPAGPETLVTRTVYGEAHPDAVALNLRGRPYLLLDGAGIVATERYDFKGNPLASTRRLAIDYHATPDWSATAALTDVAAIEAAAAPLLDPETFTTQLTYDALNRVTSRTTPDASVTLPTYNEAGLLERVTVRLLGAADATVFVANLDYNARGQRTLLAHGNGTTTTYAYDPETFRLTELRTARDSGGAVLQNLAYTYDASGNIVQIADAVSYGNPAVSADGLYEYDAIYQLTAALGREHPGQQPTDADSELLRLDHPSDLQALRRYRQTYAYDPAGNILAMAHAPLGGGPPGWTRAYAYAADSNRLLATSLPGDAPGTFSAAYTYDARGNMTSMPHLSTMRWDHADRLAAADRGGGGTVFFTYDATGQRARKAYEHGGLLEERIYLGGYEVYRKRNLATGAVSMERQTLHVADDAHRVALVETKTVDTTIPAFTPSTRLRYQLDNHLGSSCLELDATAAVITYEEYFPYGATSFHAADSATDVPAKRYRYTGKERDDETGLDYVTARYYAPWLGRWTTPDHSGLVDGTNLYAYVRNRPTCFIDTDGRQAEDADRTGQRQPPKFNPNLDHATYFVVTPHPHHQRTRPSGRGNSGPAHAPHPASGTGSGHRTGAAGQTARGKSSGSDSGIDVRVSGWIARILGLVRILGGYAEAAAGTALLFTPIPGARFIGGALILHGVDAASTGAREVISGRPQRTLTSQGIQAATGVDTNTADWMDAGIGLGATTGANKVVRALAPPLPKPSPSSDLGRRLTDEELREVRGGSRDAEMGRAAKPVNLPAWRRITVDMVHILERHVPGAPYAAGRTVFPATMSERGILRAIREAYESSSIVGRQGSERLLLSGRGSGLTIEMWFNKLTRTIETAYPVP